MTAPDARALLADSARRFSEDRFPLTDLRDLRDGRAPASRIRELWSQIGGLGWAGLLVSESAGGSGGALTDVGIVLEQLGRQLAVTPMIESGVLAALAVGRYGSDELRAELLPTLVDGTACVAFAIEETPRWSTSRIATTGTPRSGGVVLNGRKLNVKLGPIADRFVVVARTEQTYAWCVIDRDAAGVCVADGTLIDGQPVSVLTLENVFVAEPATLRHEPGAIEQTVQAGSLALCAWMLGGLRRAFEITVAYLKERIQFGVPIGAFQALQHRAAQLHCAIELAEAIVHQALEAFAAGEPDAVRLAHACKAHVSDTFLRVAEEGVQMHGGIGMTDEADIGLYLKAARVAELAFGDAAHHRGEYARLAGY